MDKVITDIDDLGVAQVRLNNPDKHNAFDDEMIWRAYRGICCDRRQF